MGNFLAVISRNYPLQVPPDSLQWTGLCGNAKQLNVGQGPCVNNSIPILFSEGEVGKKKLVFCFKNCSDLLLEKNLKIYHCIIFRLFCFSQFSIYTHSGLKFDDHTSWMWETSMSIKNHGKQMSRKTIYDSSLVIEKSIPKFAKCLRSLKQT